MMLVYELMMLFLGMSWLWWGEFGCVGEVQGVFVWGGGCCGLVMCGCGLFFF